MRQLHKSKWFLAALIGGVVLLTLAGLGLLGAYFYFSRQANGQVAWVSPFSAIRPKTIAPDLAVLSLAGEPDDRVIRAALDAGEVETAYAGLATSVLLPDSLRSGHWLLLADRYQKSEPARAILAIQAALDVAALSPMLGDMARADISLQAATRFMALKQAPDARLALAQAENIGRYSPLLLPAQRRAILERVEAAYRAAGEATLASAVRKDLDSASAGPGVKIEPPPALLPGLRGAVTLPPAVVAAVAARQQAAAQMASRWLSASPNARKALAEALGQALVAEDVARAEFYQSAAELPDADRLALLHDRVAWLTGKYRAANDGFGASLVPDWAAEIAATRQELVEAHTNLINGYGRQLDGLAPADASQARVELLRQGLLAVRLGLFPDLDAERTLSEQLSDASRELWTRQGSVGLVNSVQEVQGRRFYLLAGADTRRAPAK
jgi:hypothetical protein